MPRNYLLNYFILDASIIDVLIDLNCVLCSESGQFCAIKEVQVILDDLNSKERLRQLNQVICVPPFD